MRSIIPRAEEFAIPRVLRALGITTPVLAVKDFTLDSERVESLHHATARKYFRFRVSILKRYEN
jgi:hypothetical protein